MELLYLDESGSTGLDFDNKNQPFFVLAGVSVSDKNWHKINDYFEKEKIKIYPDFQDIEIHTNELYNSNKKSHFYKNDWKYNFEILEKLVDLISNLDIKLCSTLLYKPAYKKHFGNNIIVDPYLYSFAVTYEKFNSYLIKNNDYGITFCDELKKMEESLEVLYPRLKCDNKNVIERTFYLNSKKNNFIQIADVCAFYINKYHCIQKGCSTMDDFKKNHCIKMFHKIEKIYSGTTKSVNLNDFDNYFK